MLVQISFLTIAFMAPYRSLSDKAMMYFGRPGSLRVFCVTIFPLAAILLTIICWMLIEKRWQHKMARIYVSELQYIESLTPDKRVSQIESIFKKSQSSIYKAYFGAKLINELYATDPEKTINIARQLLSASGLPDYIMDAISTKLAYVYLDQLTKMSRRQINITDKSNEIKQYLSSNKKNSVFYPLRRESFLEILLLNKRLRDYHEGIIALQQEERLPKDMMERLSLARADIESLLSAEKGTHS